MINRITVIDDFTANGIAVLGEQFYKLATVQQPLNMPWFLGLWKSALEQGVGALWVYEQGGKVVGVLGAMISPCLFTGGVVATESFWFVDENYRKGRGGIGLFMEFIRWAKELGVNRVVSAHISGSFEDELRSFYEKLGFQKLETTYFLEL